MLKRSRYVFHVQDLQPDAAVGLGMMKAHGVPARTLHFMAAQAYRHAATVSGISRAMIEAFADKGVPAEKRYWFPNWVETPGLRTTGLTGWRTRYGIPQEAFLASYSGNLGRKQGLEVLLDAAGTLACGQRQESPPVVILIAGDGVMRPALEARLREHPLPNVRILPLLPEADYREMLAASDVCLITQAKATGRFFLPSKLLPILAAGRPVVALADETSELARAVHEGAFGVVVPSGDAEGLARTLRGLATSPGELAQFGLNGANWVTRFEADSVLGQFERRVLQEERSRR
jgi:colanic acid biosynthesis glycosyl transferase WcaI